MAKLYLMHYFNGRLVADSMDVKASAFADGAVANYVKYGEQLLFYPAHHPLEKGTAVFADSPDGRLIAIALEAGGKLPLVGAPIKEGNNGN